jgi:hypothetical protein
MAENRYALFDKPERVGVENALDELVRATVKEYDKIKQLPAEVGVGDTATDEAIARVIYQAIHFREIP